jgi:dihydrofolate synthase / folylpolyglutamate synthase
MDYQESVDYIFGRTNYEMIPRVPHIEANYDLRRVFELLERLGNPHLKAKSLHITGTNGKGSTSAMLSAILTASGYSTGLYTSPHLLTMRERFMIDGQMITEAEVAGITTRIRPDIEAVDKKGAYGKLTVFEILTVLGFVWFAQKGCQFQVMEVGMGGRFDSTNVIQPEICLMTAISLDHTEILGDTLTKIATEKSGIIKPGCTAISHPQAEEVDKVIRETCREKGVQLIRVGRDVTVKGICHDLEHQELEVKGRLDSYPISIPLLGQYQMDNAAAAVAGLEVLMEKGYTISRDSILHGLAGVDFPGRMQVIHRRPWIVLDGGHNPGAAHRLQEAIREYFQSQKSILVIGIFNDKDFGGIVKELTPVFSRVIVTRANNPRATRPEVLAAEFAKYGVQAQVTESVAQALIEAMATAKDDELICVTGSLYVVGEAISIVRSKEWGVRNQ